MKNPEIPKSEPNLSKSADENSKKMAEVLLERARNNSLLGKYWDSMHDLSFLPSDPKYLPEVSFFF